MSENGYSDESELRSENESHGIEDDAETITTYPPIQPESAQNALQLHNSLTSRPQSFPYEPNTSRIIADRVRELSLKYEIREELSSRLHALEEYELIVVCDDSGSMKTKVDGTDRTRWDELKDFVKIILEVGTIFDPRGIDIYFLNRRPIYHVMNLNSVDEIFQNPPRGYTPLVHVLKNIFQLPSTRRDHDKKVLVFVATDGAPTDDCGNINIHELEHLMIHERRAETTHVMFLVCTDDKTCVDYLNRWDKDMINVDVTNDFKNERDTIRKCQGPNYHFSKGDYIVKALIGAIDQNIDDLNERMTNTSLQ